MYTVECDGVLLLDPEEEDLIIIDPKLELEDNKSGSFEFKIAESHPFYERIEKWTSRISVYDDDVLLWRGRVYEESTDFWKRKTFKCEGELAYFNDSVQPPKQFNNLTVRGYLEALITQHNNNCEEKFTVGVVTVVDNNDNVYKYTNWESTMEVLKSDLIDTYGGHFRIRHENGTRYIDYLADYPRVSEQVIEFGTNLLDFSTNYDMTDICTVLYPLGAKLEESSIPALEEHTTIESVNGGARALVNADAVAKYGRIEKTVVWDNVTDPSNLKAKGEKYLQDFQYENMVLEVSAVDLHGLDADVDAIRHLDEVRVVSMPHGLNRRFPVTKLSIPLLNPAQRRLTLGTDSRTTMTARSVAIADELSKKIADMDEESIIAKALKEAAIQASEIIKDGINGHVVVNENEILIMDTNDKATARKLWRWNTGGLGYSSTGYNGTYGTAITNDGQILGNMIAANTIKALQIDVNNLFAQNITASGTITGVTLRGAYGEFTKGFKVNSINTSGDGTSYMEIASDSSGARFGGYNSDGSCYYYADGEIGTIAATGVFNIAVQDLNIATGTVSMNSKMIVYGSADFRSLAYFPRSDWLKINSIHWGDWGNPVIGISSGDVHEYALSWTDNGLEFWIDKTKVGTNFSDKRLKKDIKDIDIDFIEAVGAVELTQFRFNRELESDDIRVGVIAQDLVESLENHGCDVDNYGIIKQGKQSLDDDEKYYSLEYNDFIIARLAHDENRIAELETEVEELKGMVKSLLERVK